MREVAFPNRRSVWRHLVHFYRDKVRAQSCWTKIAEKDRRGNSSFGLSDTSGRTSSNFRNWDYKKRGDKHWYHRVSVGCGNFNLGCAFLSDDMAGNYSKVWQKIEFLFQNFGLLQSQLLRDWKQRAKWRGRRCAWAARARSESAWLWAVV